jgi:SAM-dependent methyltransferase
MARALRQSGWSKGRVVADYASRDYTTVAETRLLEHVSASIDDGAVLDVGVGAGRTIPLLEPRAKRYVAIDYSAAMVDAAKKRFATTDIRVGDARNLPFADGEFSFVFFSFNGIDYIHPDERGGALRELFRVLRPGGSLAFSTHNLGSPDVARGFHFEGIRPTTNPVRRGVRIVRGLLETGRALFSYGNVRPSEFERSEVAFINDGAHGYALLTCYVRIADQVEQLHQVGFDKGVVLFDRDGEPTTSATDSLDVHIVATKRR